MFYKILIYLMCIEIINIVIGQQITSSHITASVHTFFFIDNDKWPELNSECVTSTGTSGQCKQAHNCPKDRFKLTLTDICFFEQKNPVVCCENNNSVNSSNPKIPNLPSNSSVLPASLISPSNPKIPNSSPDTSNLPVSEKLVNPNNFNNPNTSSSSLNSSEDIKSEKIVEDPRSVPLNSVYRKIQLSDRTANRKCIEYQSPDGRNLLELNQYLVTRPPHSAFVSGNVVALTDNPQMAALGWNRSDGSIDWKCGGAIISENFIITAAHCAYDGGLAADTIRVGDLNLLKDDNDTVSQQFDVIEIFVHPSYNQNLMYNDIALMKFSPDAIFDRYVRPACLWTEPNIPIYVPFLVAMGYGTDAFAGKRTNELFEGKLAHVPLENCRQALGTNFQIPNGIIESQICAKDPAGKADTCQGDSGGPLVFRTGYSLSTIQHLVGITSFGESCAGSNPGVYTNVSSYIDWIEPIVWPTE